MSMLQIAPDADQILMLQPATYGEQGEATIQRVIARAVPGEKNAGRFYIDINVAVDAPEGRIFVSTSPFGNHNTQTGAKTGSKVNQFLTQLGLEPTFAGEPDGDGNYPYLGADPSGRKVIVKVGLESWKDRTSGAQRSRNTVEDIWARA